MKSSIKYISEKLRNAYDSRECTSIARYIVEELSGLSFTDILLKDTKFPEETTKKIEDITNQLLTGRPLQYILGYTYFCDLKLKVDENVLIPRPETEELCRLIINDFKDKSPTVFDICSGSGCIALSLKNGISSAKVYGGDISEGALMIANRNKEQCDLEVDFFKYDALNDNINDNIFFDIIVSNPPYICKFEKEKMCSNVLDFEPHLALFVEDDNPLIFYDRIADTAYKKLNNGGNLYFEINPLFSKELKALLEQKKFSDITIINDINERERFIKCTKRMR